ncbi:hypothetical protein M407DRAFT_165835 [Tulasnella calospora MUT 4182]|uniref:Uncharacterized protein n=1 Tax=Tulasnella calospora MUT 4182 TaxID=1051891 RepID=A0A0C3QM31_9AGAM|nr:hypothetical protein M407DRAFT_165835 [Tulasnella calospora MUT 4182]
MLRRNVTSGLRFVLFGPWCARRNTQAREVTVAGCTVAPPLELALAVMLVEQPLTTDPFGAFSTIKRSLGRSGSSGCSILSCDGRVFRIATVYRHFI